jgi:hypothetical protein
MFQIYNDKRGGEKWISPVWIFLIVIVAGVVSVGVSILAGAEIDTRSFESEILNNRIYDCLYKDVFDKSYFDEDLFYDYCDFNKEIFEGEGYYFNIILFDDSLGVVKEFSGGNFQIKMECDLQFGNDWKKGSEAEKWAKCFIQEKNIFYFDGNEIKSGVAEILTGVNNNGEEISIAE